MQILKPSLVVYVTCALMLIPNGDAQGIGGFGIGGGRDFGFGGMSGGFRNGRPLEDVEYPPPPMEVPIPPTNVGTPSNGGTYRSGSSCLKMFVIITVGVVKCNVNVY